MSDAEVLRELRAHRRRRRLAGLDWIDALYRVYLTAIFGIVAVVVASDLIGDDAVTAAQLTDVRDHGAAWAALVPAVAIAVALRSGSRGGPIAVEAAEVRHVLLAPVDRATALRAVSLRQLRFALFLGPVVGAIAGQLTHRRLPGSAAAWAACGALFGAVSAATFIGTALLVSTWRWRRSVATALAVAVLVSALADAAGTAPGPMRAFGMVALWPLEFDPLGLIAVAAAVALAVAGQWFVGGQSLEDMERRAALVGQLRFAVTMQDLRTALVLQRQLAQDLPRTRPWLARPSSRGRRRRFPVWHRSWTGLRRFPIGRVLRVIGSSLVAALAMIGVDRGTTPLAVVAAAAAYLAGLDLVEPMAQQIDQADRTDLLPVPRGILLVRYLPALLVAALVAAAPGAALAAALVEPAAAALAVPIALCGVSAAVVSVAMQLPDTTKDGAVLPPEFAGMKIAIRTGMPLLVALVGTLPAIALVKVSDDTRTAAATNASAAVLFVVAAVAAWLRFGAEARAWWAQVLEQSQGGARPAGERNRG